MQTAPRLSLSPLPHHVMLQTKVWDIRIYQLNLILSWTVWRLSQQVATYNSKYQYMYIIILVLASGLGNTNTNCNLVCILIPKLCIRICFSLHIYVVLYSLNKTLPIRLQVDNVTYMPTFKQVYRRTLKNWSLYKVKGLHIRVSIRSKKKKTR